MATDVKFQFVVNRLKMEVSNAIIEFVIRLQKDELSIKELVKLLKNQSLKCSTLFKDIVNFIHLRNEINREDLRN